ncbi:MAG TPA: sulfate transporter family protein [Xanthobacteraceae bacterium]|nr:sulfate transporter family protein [Xanthobacteraceae bacterium]
MLDAAAQALSQMLSPAFRGVLYKSIGLALILIILVGIGLQHVLLWLADNGEGMAENALGPRAHVPLAVLGFILSVATGLGIIIGSVFLMPAVTALVASFFVDEIALAVERSCYPGEPEGKPLPFVRAVIEGVRTALLAVAIYLLALPFLLLAGFGAIIFFACTAYILGREYFELAAMRYHTVADAKALRKAHAGTVFMAGLFIAGFISIPVVNLATPLFGMAFMVHVHRRLAGAAYASR